HVDPFQEAVPNRRTRCWPGTPRRLWREAVDARDPDRAGDCVGWKDDPYGSRHGDFLEVVAAAVLGARPGSLLGRALPCPDMHTRDRHHEPASDRAPGFEPVPTTTERSASACSRRRSADTRRVDDSPSAAGTQGSAVLAVPEVRTSSCWSARADCSTAGSAA